MSQQYEIIKTNGPTPTDTPTYEYKCVYLYGSLGMVDSSGWRDTEASAMRSIDKNCYPDRYFVALVRRIVQ